MRGAKLGGTEKIACEDNWAWVEGCNEDCFLPLKRLDVYLIIRSLILISTYDTVHNFIDYNIIIIS